jgi:hypothetical protein
MPEPRPIRALLAETLAAIRAAGPVLTKLDVSPQLYATLSRAHFADQALHGYSAAPWLGVPVYVDRELPPYARREHYSDGRVITRYRLVMDPRVLQVSFRDQTYASPPEGPERHGLSLMVRWGRAWIYAEDVDACGCSWKGARSCPYLPGLARVAELAGLELEPWQRARAAQALRAQLSYGHGVVMDPKLGKLGGHQL